MGPGRLKAFWKTYQDTYITAADIHFLKSIGHELYRIPLIRLFTPETYMAKNNPTAFRAAGQGDGGAKKEGLYVC